MELRDIVPFVFWPWLIMSVVILIRRRSQRRAAAAAAAEPLPDLLAPPPPSGPSRPVPGAVRPAATDAATPPPLPAIVVPEGASIFDAALRSPSVGAPGHHRGDGAAASSSPAT